MTGGPAALAAAIVVIAFVAAMVTMSRMSNGAVLPSSLFRVSTWWKAMKWTVALTVAAFAGAIAGSGTAIATAALLAGGAALVVEAILMSYAKAFGPRE
jgi:hypothetical protein